MRIISTTDALRCAAMRVAIDIETPIVFVYLSQRAAQHCIVHYRSLSFTIAHNAQRTAAIVETGLNTLKSYFPRSNESLPRGFNNVR